MIARLHDPGLPVIEHQAAIKTASETLPVKTISEAAQHVNYKYACKLVIF